MSDMSLVLPQDENKQMAKKLRQEKILPFLIQGWHLSTIAKQLNVSFKTIQRDKIEIIKNTKTQELKNITKEDIYAELLLTKKDLTKRLWAIALDGKTSTRDRITALNSIAERDNDLFKRAQAVGLIPQNPETFINIDNSINVKGYVGFSPDEWDEKFKTIEVKSEQVNDKGEQQ